MLPTLKAPGASRTASKPHSACDCPVTPTGSVLFGPCDSRGIWPLLPHMQLHSPRSSPSPSGAFFLPLRLAKCIPGLDSCSSRSPCGHATPHRHSGPGSHSPEGPSLHRGQRSPFLAPPSRGPLGSSDQSCSDPACLILSSSCPTPWNVSRTSARCSRSQPSQSLA